MSEKIRKETAPCHTDPGRIPWEEYETLDADVRDGLSPEEYVKRQRRRQSRAKSGALALLSIIVVLHQFLIVPFFLSMVHVCHLGKYPIL